MKKALIIDLKLNNIGSITESISRLGISCKTKLSKKNIHEAEILILPGVGSYPSAMKKIKKNNIDKIIYNFVRSKKKIIGICLGMQLLFEKSNEFLPTRGLSLIKGEVVSLTNSIKSKDNSLIPNIGWHSIKTTKNKSKLFKKLDKKKFYFVHSFHVKPKNKSIITSYIKLNGVKIVSSVQSKNIIGLQFHPEKSGKDGEKLLSNFLKQI
tara:strand:+ start:951 stop:1580 length:630 start_codon:yes stop_codon:yes gene_type:complete